MTGSLPCPLLILLLFPVSQGALAVINWCRYTSAHAGFAPEDGLFKRDTAGTERTIVVIPTVLSGPGDVQETPGFTGDPVSGKPGR
jgi:hypothetical protein